MSYCLLKLLVISVSTLRNKVNLIFNLIYVITMLINLIEKKTC